jgi:hypothetical protein
MKNIFKKPIFDLSSINNDEGDEPPGKTLVQLNSQSFFKTKKKAGFFYSLKQKRKRIFFI